jgi:hypothetical protein
MEESGKEFPIRVSYDSAEDTLTFSFTPSPIAGVAEEAADEVWVRYEPATRHVLTVDVLNFSKRVQEIFGPELKYTERTDPQRLEALTGLAIQAEN